MPLRRFIVFVAALVLMPAAWARAPHAVLLETGVHRISTTVQFHREEASRIGRNSAGALRFELDQTREPIYATQNPR